MKNFRRKTASAVEEDNPYWMSFSDIMAGLLVIFILAAVALILELQEKQNRFDDDIEQLKAALRIKKNIVTEIKAALKEQDIEVLISENDSVIRIPEEVLTFPQARYKMPWGKKARNNALEIGEVLYRAIAKDQRWEYLDTVFIEGHTDKIPYRNKSIKGNWGLSTFRAISVWNFWNESMSRGSTLDTLKNSEGKQLFSVSGYAETRPNPDTVNLQDGPVKYKKDRRIDIRFTTKRPSLQEYESVKDNVDQ